MEQCPLSKGEKKWKWSHNLTISLISECHCSLPLCLGCVLLSKYELQSQTANIEIVQRVGYKHFLHTSKWRK